MTDLAPRPPKRSSPSVPRSSTDRPGSRSAQTASRRNPAVIRGAVVVLCIGLLVTAWAVWRHTIEAAYADRGVTTVGVIASSGSILAGPDVVFSGPDGRSHRVRYQELGGPRLGLLDGTVPIEFLADRPETARYDRDRMGVVGNYTLAGLVVGFGLFGLHLGTSYGTPLDRRASRKP